MVSDKEVAGKAHVLDGKTDSFHLSDHEHVNDAVLATVTSNPQDMQVLLVSQADSAVADTHVPALELVEETPRLTSAQVLETSPDALPQHFLLELKAGADAADELSKLYYDYQSKYDRSLQWSGEIAPGVVSLNLLPLEESAIVPSSDVAAKGDKAGEHKLSEENQKRIDKANCQLEAEAELNSLKMGLPAGSDAEERRRRQQHLVYGVDEQDSPGHLAQVLHARRNGLNEELPADEVNRIVQERSNEKWAEILSLPAGATADDIKAAQKIQLDAYMAGYPDTPQGKLEATAAGEVLKNYWDARYFGLENPEQATEDDVLNATQDVYRRQEALAMKLDANLPQNEVDRIKAAREHGLPDDTDESTLKALDEAQAKRMTEMLGECNVKAGEPAIPEGKTEAKMPEELFE